jgi:hypothetical protein
MKYLIRFACVFFSLLLAETAFAEKVDLPEQTIAETWLSFGQGAIRYQNRMLFLQEAEETSGVMVVSPEPYPENVTLRYELMPMNAASVCVAVLSASSDGKGTPLIIPENYDGGISLLTRDSQNYFFAFHNAAHNRPPFLRKFPEGTALAMTEANVMQVGQFHTMEVSRNGSRLRLSINGETVIDVEDPSPLGGGHVALRIRGINGMQAACYIRNVSIETE